MKMLVQNVLIRYTDMLQFFHIPNLFNKRIFADPVSSKFVGYWDGGTLLGNVIDSSFHKFWPIHFRAIGKVWPRRGAVFFRMFSWRWVQIEKIWDPISANGSNHGLCYLLSSNYQLAPETDARSPPSPGIAGTEHSTIVCTRPEW